MGWQRGHGVARGRMGARNRPVPTVSRLVSKKLFAADLVPARWYLWHRQ